MRKNSDITSRAEAKRRLDNGEVFYLTEADAVIKRDNKHIYRGNSPYRFEDKYGNEALEVAWNSYREWESEYEWFDNIPKQGVLCWVKDHEEDDTPLISIITRYRSFCSSKFSTRTGMLYKFATPVTEKETFDLYFRG